MACVLTIASAVVGQAPKEDAPEPATTAAPQAEEGAAPAPTPAATGGDRTALNLLGQEDTKSGEGRRNENVQFNLVDTNALQELNVRLGVTATIVQEFDPEQGYFGAEMGSKSSGGLHNAAKTGGGVHGKVYWRHLNSVLTARSFFQVGAVQPARENDYGGDVALTPWEGGRLSLGGSAQDIRGQVNGNVLVPRPDERTPLTDDPARRAIVVW